MNKLIILYHNCDWEDFEGTLEEAIRHLLSENRYSNYGHDGATIISGKEVYQISRDGIETNEPN